mmetsp:Transcript_45330/g.45883  ORF Transcript_45330/g.45883 Transcript_45330/m.45883 type:complete len:145 (-) Transcript_45330:355-789(-)
MNDIRTTTTLLEEVTYNENNEGSEGDENEVPIPASLLLTTVYRNPCAICLETFVPEDNVIFCSNHITTNNTNSGPQQHHTTSCTVGYPAHCFHEECSFNYMYSHTKGVQAPCPLCRKVFWWTKYSCVRTTETIETTTTTTTSIS